MASYVTTLLGMRVRLIRVVVLDTCRELVRVTTELLSDPKKENHEVSVIISIRRHREREKS